MQTDESEMRLVAFGFVEPAEAEAAVEELRQVLDVGVQDLAIHEIAGSPEFINGFKVGMGGRIRETRLADAVIVAERHGGRMLTDIPEAWVFPATNSSAALG